MKKLLSILLSAALLLGIAACGQGPSGQSQAPGGTQAPDDKTIEHPSSIVICASNSGNIWYSCAVKISELLMKEFPDMSVTVIEGGGDANIDVVNLGADAQLGFTSSTSLVPAFAGENENVKDCSNVKALMSVQMSYAQTAVLASSDIHSFSDLAGKRVAAGTYGQVAMYTMNALLEGHGMSESDLAGGAYQVVSPSEYPDQFSDGHLDACHINGNLPLATLVQIDSTDPIRLLQPTDEAIAFILDKYPSFYTVDVPADQYAGQTEAMKLLAYDGMLMANGDLPGEFLARVVELIVESGDEMFTRASWERCGIFITQDNTAPEVYELLKGKGAV